MLLNLLEVILDLNGALFEHQWDIRNPFNCTMLPLGIRIVLRETIKVNLLHL